MGRSNSERSPMLYDGRATDALRKRPTCNFCDKLAVVDAMINAGLWAYLCPIHYLEHGIGLGIGRGQVLLCGDSMDADLIRATLE